MSVDAERCALRERLDAEGANVFTTEMLAAVGDDLGAFDALGEDFILFVEPPSLDERIVNQYALFSLMALRLQRTTPRSLSTIRSSGGS
jgi:hypothetical protein